jgi:hypothetical protein
MVIMPRWGKKTLLILRLVAGGPDNLFQLPQSTTIVTFRIVRLPSGSPPQVEVVISRLSWITPDQLTYATCLDCVTMGKSYLTPE